MQSNDPVGTSLVFGEPEETPKTKLVFGEFKRTPRTNWSLVNPKEHLNNQAVSDLVGPSYI